MIDWLNIIVWALWRNYLCTINGIQARCTFIGFSCKIIMQARCTHDGKIWFIFLLAVITNTVHLTWGFLCKNFLQTFFLATIFSVFQPPTSTFLSFTPPLAVVFCSNSLSDKVELFYAWRSASRIRDSFSLETKKTKINIVSQYVAMATLSLVHVGNDEGK